MQEERERNEVAMYETVNDLPHTPAPYEEVREVKRSQDIQLTSNEAYGPLLRENIQTTPMDKSTCDSVCVEPLLLIYECETKTV